MGTVFSICAGILIGLKIHYAIAAEKEDKKAEDIKTYRRILKELWYGSGGIKND